MKALVSLGLLLSISSAFADSEVGVGTSHVVRIEQNVPALGVIRNDQISISGESAKLMFDKMVLPSSAAIVDNSCHLKNGTRLDVKVVEKTGKSFKCAKWPSECWGADYYTCVANLILDDGSVK
ncbi:MAG: hypothetical protein EOP09_05110 [Proteobacteria bacterium]|nr:MAG: hypothetical protein EOP09_05110 [Pseudomonadota bacterium]